MQIELHIITGIKQGKTMKKLSLLLLFSFIHLAPTNIQPMEEDDKKTIYEFFSIKKKKNLPKE